MLHVTMALIQAMLNRLAAEADGNANLAAELSKRLQSSQIGIKLYATDKFSKIIQKTRINRSESLSILENHAYLLEALDQESKHDKKEIQQVQSYILLQSTKLLNLSLGEAHMETAVGITYPCDARRRISY
jgi:hypothetical protein